MLPGQDSGTNQTASTTIFADPAFDNFLTNETFSAMEYPTQDLVKTEEDETTNLGFQQITQHMRREAQQQQNNMARPGQHQLHGLDHNEDNTLKQIESALAVGTAGTATLQLPTKAEPERPCTPPQQFNVCRSLHARIDMVQWLTQAQVNSQSLQTPVHIPSTSGAKKCPEAGPWSHRPSGPTSSLQATTTTTASAPQRPCDAHLPIPTTKAHWKLSCIASFTAPDPLRPLGWTGASALILPFPQRLNTRHGFHRQEHRVRLVTLLPNVERPDTAHVVV